jgi:hypothetical protein
MCGLGVSTIFIVAIAVIVILVVLALVQTAFGGWYAHITATPYWNIIAIVIGGVVAILILLFIWRLAECVGLVGGRLSEFSHGVPQYAAGSAAVPVTD